MPTSIENKIVLTTERVRKAQDGILLSNLGAIGTTALTQELRARGWSFDVDKEPDYGDSMPDETGDGWARFAIRDYTNANQHRYELYVVLNFSRKDDQQPAPGELENVLKRIVKAAKAKSRGGFKLTVLNGEEYIPTTNGKPGNELLGYVEPHMPQTHDEFMTYFTGANAKDQLYGLDPQISIVESALRAGVRSEWRHRLNCVLEGPPGCGKSQILKNLTEMFGAEAVIHFDATATTQAGLIDVLTDRAVLPRVIFVEEIEKADPEQLRILLSILDIRGEINKNTARDRILVSTKLFCVATVNDVGRFNSLNAGALASRFSNKIWFKRPTRDVLEQILRREIDQVPTARRAWVKPALDYCLLESKPAIRDPRQVLAIGLEGGNDLLTHVFQDWLIATSFQPGEDETDDDENASAA